VCEKKKGGRGRYNAALPQYCCPGEYQGKGGWGWRPAVRGGKGVWAKGVGPRTRGTTVHSTSTAYSSASSQRRPPLRQWLMPRSTQASAQLTSIKDDVKALRKHEGGSRTRKFITVALTQHDGDHLPTSLIWLASACSF